MLGRSIIIIGGIKAISEDLMYAAARFDEFFHPLQPSIKLGVIGAVLRSAIMSGQQRQKLGLKLPLRLEQRLCGDGADAE